MGLYINYNSTGEHLGTTRKAQKLIDSGDATLLEKLPVTFAEIPKAKVCVFVVENAGFEAAAVATTEMLFLYYRRGHDKGTDPRPVTHLLVERSVNVLKGLCGGLTASDIADIKSIN